MSTVSLVRSAAVWRRRPVRLSRRNGPLPAGAEDVASARGAAVPVSTTAKGALDGCSCISLHPLGPSEVLPADEVLEQVRGQSCKLQVRVAGEFAQGSFGPFPAHLGKGFDGFSSEAPICAASQC